MDAIVSGQATLAILKDGERNLVYHLDQHGPPLEIYGWEVEALLRDANDAKTLGETTLDDVKVELEAAWSEDRCLHMVLIILDPSVRPSLRAEAIECADSLLMSARTQTFVENRLYAATLPVDSCIDVAIRDAERKNCSNLRQLLYDVTKDQEEIERRIRAWSEVPLSLFESSEAKASAKITLRNAGAFRRFVQDRQLGSTALIQLLVDPAIRALRNHRSILQEWAKPFNESVAGSSRGTVENLREPDRWRNDDLPPSRRGSISAADALHNVSRQKDAIKALLKEGSREKARDFINQLVRSQRVTGTSEHIAMSLCDLAKYAGLIGDVQLELELCEWATLEAPEDSWAWAQLGHAQRLSSRFQDALTSYDRAKLYGDERIALCGRAEVLKDSGLLEEALEVYRTCKERFSDDSVPWTATASALADFGDFEAALSAYDEAIARFPDSEHPICGKAQALRDMGRFGEALSCLTSAERRFGPRVVTDTLRAQILRETGRLVEAERLFEQVVQKDDINIYAYNGMALTLRDMRRFADAERVYATMQRRFVMDYQGFLGMAGVLKIKGDYNASMLAYSEALDRFPSLLLARNGKASVLASMGKYMEALRILPEKPPMTLHEWVSYHIRGIILLKRHNYQDAIDLFRTGLDRVPWAHQRQFFGTSLSTALIKRNEFLEARKLLDSMPAPPTLMPIQTLLNMHICAGLGEMSRGLEFSRRLDDNRYGQPILKTRKALVDLVSGRRPFTSSSVDFIFSTECDVILGFAA